MIKKSRIAVIWRRTLIMFALLQSIGVLIFAFDLYAILGGATADSVTELVLAFAAFTAFSAIVLWFMSAITSFIQSRAGAEQ